MGGKALYVMGIDPSGSFKEGQGTTGWCVIKSEDKVLTLISVGEVNAEQFDTAEEYWDAHTDIIARETVEYETRGEVHVSMEAYVLYANKAKAQINSEMETSQLIGAIRVYCYQAGIPLFMRTAGQVKDRWSDHILQHKGLDLKGLSGHIKDSIRHAVAYATFGK